MWGLKIVLTAAVAALILAGCGATDSPVSFNGQKLQAPAADQSQPQQPTIQQPPPPPPAPSCTSQASCGAYAYSGWTDPEGGWYPTCARSGGSNDTQVISVPNPAPEVLECPAGSPRAVDQACTHLVVYPSDWSFITADSNGNCWVYCCPPGT